MKKLHIKAVATNMTTKMEKVLNTFRIGMNDWDKTKTFNTQGQDVVIYTILCEDDTFESIKEIMKHNV